MEIGRIESYTMRGTGISVDLRPPEGRQAARTIARKNTGSNKRTAHEPRRTKKTELPGGRERK